jgi:uncharacterized membrane protein (UPF0127 family)
MYQRNLLLTCTLLVLAAGCGSDDGNDAAGGLPPAFRSMKEAEIALISPSGRRTPVKVRVADDRSERMSGFQHVPPDVVAKTQILFVFAEPVATSFHMRNCTCPLDIAFADARGVVTGVLTMRPGGDEYNTPGEILYAVEAREGFFAKHNIIAGSRIEVPDVSATH